MDSMHTLGITRLARYTVPHAGFPAQAQSYLSIYPRTSSTGVLFRTSGPRYALPFVLFPSCPLRTSLSAPGVNTDPFTRLSSMQRPANSRPESPNSREEGLAVLGVTGGVSHHKDWLLSCGTALRSTRLPEPSRRFRQQLLTPRTASSIDPCLVQLTPG